jgi:hypothetical protein
VRGCEGGSGGPLPGGPSALLRARDAAAMGDRNSIIVHAMGRGGGGGGSGSESEGESSGAVSTANAAPCAEPTCHLAALLSFKCDGCARLYCLSHRLPHAHRCPQEAAASKQVFVCPLCKLGVVIVPGEEIHTTFERHERSEQCRGAVAARRAGKAVGAPRCPVKGCKEKLVAGMAMRCGACKVQHCILHRDPALHACGRAKAAAAPPAPNLSLLGRFAASVGGRSPKAAAAQPPPKPAPVSTTQQVKDTAERRKRSGGGGGGCGGGDGDVSPHSCSIV